MLIYNLFVLLVAFLLALDYYVHKYDTHLQQGGTRVAIENVFMYLALGLIVFFAGFRYEVGYDYLSYLAGYLYDKELSHWEPLFVFLVRFIRHFNFGLDAQAMFFFFSAVIVIIIYKALRSLTPHYRFGILFYILIPSLYLNSFSVIRQALALSILLFGLQFITKQVPEYKKYIVVSFIAFLFHYNSIFVSLLFIFGGVFFQRVHSWIIYTSAIVISFFLYFVHIGRIFLSYLPGTLGLYIKYELPVSPLKLLIVNGFFLFLMMQKEHFIKNKLESYLFNSVFIGLLIFNIFGDFIYVTRLAQYFLVAEIVLVPYYLYSINNHFRRKVFIGLFLIYYLFNFNYALYRDEQSLHGKNNALVPYRNYFTEEHKSNKTINLEVWYNYISETKQVQEKEELMK